MAEPKKNFNWLLFLMALTMGIVFGSQGNIWIGGAGGLLVGIVLGNLGATKQAGKDDKEEGKGA